MRVFVIAEIGINHNGDLSLCKKLIDTAVFAGCDAVKFQKRNIDDVYSKEFLNSPRKSPWGNTQREQKEALEFDEKDYWEIDEYCKKSEIEWFASSWDVSSQLFMRRFETKYNKVASPMLLNIELLELIAEEGKHTFISTGMSTLTQIDDAVNIFKRKNCSFELMHCVSTYPLKDEDANLNTINTLKERYQCNVGYSGHETGLAISYAAMGLNISSLERHITIDRSMYGSDQSASLEPLGLIQLIGGVRKLQKAMGNGSKTITEEEMIIAKKLRAHI
tara:strand:+ start:1791 stop:2621 length:831 start_codon:yes stop_codon:yes gene_type:complete